MPRVLWVTQVYPRYAGDMYGGFLHRLARAVCAAGWDVTVVAPAADGVPAEETADGVRVVRFGYGRAGRQQIAYRGELHRRAIRHPVQALRFLAGMGRAVRRETDRTRPALLHAHWWIPTGLVAARNLRGSESPPLVLSLHGTDVRLAREVPPLRGLARWTMERADLVLPVSRSLAEDVRRIAPGASRVDVLPMPADATLFHPEAGEAPADGVSFTVAARLTRQKRLDVVLDAVQKLRQRGAHVRLDVAGDGSDRARLEQLTDALAIRDRVTFHGTVAAEELARLYRRSRAVVLASVSEGYGLAIVEGALCGVPAIGVRSGGIEELIEDGVHGLLVPPDDSEALASAMDRLAGDAELAARLGARAARDAERGTERPLAERLVAAYESLRKGGPGAPAEGR